MRDEQCGLLKRDDWMGWSIFPFGSMIKEKIDTKSIKPDSRAL